MHQRVLAGPRPLRTVVLATHVLTPSHLASVLMQVLAADPVVLAELGTTQAAEIAFDLSSIAAKTRSGSTFSSKKKGKSVTIIDDKAETEAGLIKNVFDRLFGRR